MKEGEEVGGEQHFHVTPNLSYAVFIYNPPHPLSHQPCVGAHPCLHTSSCLSPDWVEGERPQSPHCKMIKWLKGSNNQ